MKNFINKYNYIFTLLAITLSIVAVTLSLYRSNRLGVTAVKSTASSDTLETFRTNVNTSLTNLATYALSTTTANTFTATQSFSAIGISSTTPFGNIGIGTGSATSSISRGKYCDYAKDPAGRAMYITLSTSGNTVFSTSSVSCL